MNSKIAIPLICVGLLLVAAVVLWPKDSEDSVVDPNMVQAAEVAEGSVEGTDPSSANGGRQRVDGDGNAGVADASHAAADSDANAAEVAIVIDGQAVGYPLAFGWRTTLLPATTVLSDGFGRLRIPSGLTTMGNLTLPDGLEWAQPVSVLQDQGEYEKDGLKWDPDQPVATLDLKRQAGWHGRVLKPGARPGDVGVADAEVMVGQSREKNPEETELRSSWQFRGGRHSSNSNRGTDTDEAGNFFVPIISHDDGRMVKVSAEVQDSPIPGVAKDEWEEEEIPDDGWLGALILEEVRRKPVAVRVFDPTGAPVPEATLYLQGTSMRSANSEGIYRFKDVHETQSYVQVNADGYLPAGVSIEPPFWDKPYEVHLKPTTKLIFEVDMEEYPFSTTPQIMIHAGGDLDIRDSEGKSTGSMRVTVGSMHSTMSSSGPEPGTSKWRGEIRMKNGRVVLSGARKDLPFQVELVGPLGPLAVVDVPERDDDEFTVPLKVENQGKRIYGKVLSLEGVPLVGASVSLSDTDGHRVHKMTGLDGSFEVEGATLHELDIDVHKDGFVAFEQDGLAPPIDGNLGDFVLHEARKMRVRFMHPDGSSGPSGMSVQWKNDQDRGSGVTRDKGYFVVDGLAPHLPIDLTWTYGGIECQHRIEVGQDKVRIPLPAVGKLKVVIADSLRTALDGDCYFSLQEKGSPAPTVQEPNGFCIGLKKNKSFDAVAVGTYRACMYRLSGRGDERQLIAISQPTFVTVVAGQSNEVLLTD